MAPEQIRGAREIDARADVYAFGALLYELLTLRPPFVGEVRTIEHAHQVLRPRRPSEFGSVPKALEDLLLLCLAKEPERRPADGAVLRRAFDEMIALAPSDAQPRSGPSSTGAARSRGTKLIAEGQQPVV